MTQRIAIDPGSVRDTAGWFDTTANGTTESGRNLSSALAGVALSVHDPNFSVASFHARWEAMRSELDWLTTGYGDDRSTMLATVEAMEGADSVWSRDGAQCYLSDDDVIDRLAVVVAELGVVADSPDDPRLRVMRQRRLIAERRWLQDELGVDQLVENPERFDRFVSAYAQRFDVDEDRMRVVLAVEMADADPTGAVDDVAGDELARFFDESWYRIDDAAFVAGAVAVDPGLAVGFFNALGADGTARLPAEVLGPDALMSPNEEQPMADGRGAVVGDFATALAQASLTGRLGFTGTDLVEAGADDALAGNEPLTGRLFITDATFDTRFLVDATAATVRVRQGVVGDTDDAAITSMIVDITEFGPEASAMLIDGLNRDVQALFRPRRPLAMEPGAINPIEILVDSLRLHPLLGDDVNGLVVSQAALSTEPMPQYVAVVVERELLIGLPKFVDRALAASPIPDPDDPLAAVVIAARAADHGVRSVEPPALYDPTTTFAGSATLSLGDLVDAVAATSRSDGTNIASAEIGVIRGAVATADLRASRLLPTPTNEGQPLVNGELLSDYEVKLTGTLLGVYSQGRRNGELLDARDLDADAERNAQVVSLAGEAVFGYLYGGVGTEVGRVVGGAAASEYGARLTDTAVGTVIDVAVGTETGNMFYADNEKDVLFDHVLEGVTADDRARLIVLDYYLDSGQVVNEAIAVDIGELVRNGDERIHVGEHLDAVELDVTGGSHPKLSEVADRSRLDDILRHADRARIETILRAE